MGSGASSPAGLGLNKDQALEAIGKGVVVRFSERGCYNDDTDNFNNREQRELDVYLDARPDYAGRHAQQMRATSPGCHPEDLTPIVARKISLLVWLNQKLRPKLGDRLLLALRDYQLNTVVFKRKDTTKADYRVDYRVAVNADGPFTKLLLTRPDAMTHLGPKVAFAEVPEPGSSFFFVRDGLGRLLFRHGVEVFAEHPMKDVAFSVEDLGKVVQLNAAMTRKSNAFETLKAHDDAIRKGTSWLDGGVPLLHKDLFITTSMMAPEDGGKDKQPQPLASHRSDGKKRDNSPRPAQAEAPADLQQAAPVAAPPAQAALLYTYPQPPNQSSNGKLASTLPPLPANSRGSTVLAQAQQPPLYQPHPPPGMGTDGNRQQSLIQLRAAPSGQFAPQPTGMGMGQQSSIYSGLAATAPPRPMESPRRIDQGPLGQHYPPALPPRQWPSMSMPMPMQAHPQPQYNPHMGTSTGMGRVPQPHYPFHQPPVAPMPMHSYNQPIYSLSQSAGRQPITLAATLPALKPGHYVSARADDTAPAVSAYA
eukprot:TRINITY_DN7616_c0_g1_i1.p1 TRINITY_DN7616_c0_g1~~TRINITY_DN7616_c0_g1_i1.p1  ORF type:complete len:535 (-),score=64.12 TRINITY_DN7616_c0_g1_i1:87-1691(-)